MLLWLVTLLSCAASLAAKLAADALLHERIAIVGRSIGLQPAVNEGIAFGIRLPGAQTLFIACALAAMVWLAVRTAASAMERAAYGLIIGGALANLLDRLPDGLVTDYFQVGSFPIFNVADSCITVGAGMLLLGMLWHSIRR